MMMETNSARSLSRLRDIEVVKVPEPIGYDDAYQMQLARRTDIEQGRAGNALFLLEHRPVITLGRNAHEEHLVVSRDQLTKMGIEVCPTSRGGDITYHGPGQLVAYPILDLHQWRQSIRWYLRTLEDVLIALLEHYQLKGERIDGLTGVWVNGAKVAAIGIGIHNWVTFHGIALNVNPDMSHFACIVPCGIRNKPVTSLAQLLPTTPTMTEVMDLYETCFRRAFE